MPSALRPGDGCTTPRRLRAAGAGPEAVIVWRMLDDGRSVAQVAAALDVTEAWVHGRLAALRAAAD